MDDVSVWKMNICFRKGFRNDANIYDVEYFILVLHLSSLGLLIQYRVSSMSRIKIELTIVSVCTVNIIPRCVSKNDYFRTSPPLSFSSHQHDKRAASHHHCIDAAFQLKSNWKTWIKNILGRSKVFQSEK